VSELAALTITVCPEPARDYGNRLLLIQRDGRGAGAFGAVPNADWLANKRAKLARELYEIRRGLGNGRVDIASCGLALSQLINVGLRWTSELLGQDEYKRTSELMRLLRNLVPDWGQRERPLRIEVRHTARGADLAAVIPFEILPLFDLTQPKVPATKPDCSVLASRFLGMSGVIARQPRTRVPTQYILQRDPDLGKVRVSAYCNWSLGGVADEMEHLDDLNRDFHVNQKWPTANLPGEEAAGELARHLFGSAPMQQGGPTQIHHFACHYGWSDALDDEAFVFSAPSDNGRVSRDMASVVIDRGMLNQCRLTLAAAEPHAVRRENGPLAVLNACGTGEFHLSEREPLAWWLLGSGFGAVLGTETRVPDRVAARFSQFLYGHLGREMALGEAVRAARWDMLEKLNSPIGLFFTLHGRPELHLSPRIASPANGESGQSREERESPTH
jgi:hypothetical protein